MCVTKFNAAEAEIGTVINALYYSRNLYEILSWQAEFCLVYYIIAYQFDYVKSFGERWR